MRRRKQAPFISGEHKLSVLYSELPGAIAFGALSVTYPMKDKPKGVRDGATTLGTESDVK